jgi:hypothetical protein
LVLESGIAELKVTACAPDGSAFLRVIPELGQATKQGFAGWDAFQEAVGETVLCFDPGSGIKGVGILEPAIRVRNLDTMVVVYLIDAVRLRVNEFAQPEASLPMGEMEIVSEAEPMRLIPSNAAVL